MVRVVIDTNVLVSAVIGHGKPRRLLMRVLLGGDSAVTSRELVAELAEVLTREKFSLTEAQIARFVAIYVRRAEVVALHRRVVDAVDEDPDDNIVLDTAVSGGAAFVVTGDKHLLALEEFEEVQIVTVDTALRILAAK